VGLLKFLIIAQVCKLTVFALKEAVPSFSTNVMPRPMLVPGCRKQINVALKSFALSSFEI